MSDALEPFSLQGKLADKTAEKNLESIQELLNFIITKTNSGVSKVFNTSASYSVTVTNGFITNIS
jgi:hypothetical protein